jgi:hypothetical protein
MNKNKQLDEIYDAMDALMKAKCWTFIDNYLHDLCMKAWRTELDYLLVYATATLLAKSKLPHRKLFMDTCKHLHPDVEVWKGLE